MKKLIVAISAITFAMGTAFAQAPATPAVPAAAAGTGVATPAHKKAAKKAMHKKAHKAPASVKPAVVAPPA